MSHYASGFWNLLKPNDICLSLNNRILQYRIGLEALDLSAELNPSHLKVWTSCNSMGMRHGRSADSIDYIIVIRSNNA